MSKKAHTLKLFYMDGDVEGMVIATIPFQWSGQVLVCQRTQLSDALKRPETIRTGVYLLIGQNSKGQEQLYIGESEEVGKRIKNHDAEKDWWDRVLFITSSQSDPLNKAHVKFLESSIYERASNLKKIYLEQNKPAKSDLNESEEAQMKIFLENIYFVLPALGFDFLVEKRRDIKKEEKENILTFTEFNYKPNAYVATARLFENGEFVVLRSSEAAKDWKGVEINYTKLYHSLIQSGVLLEKNEKNYFSSDYAFTSPSAASAVIGGRSSNGKLDWEVKTTKQTYSDWEKEKLKYL